MLRRFRCFAERHGFSATTARLAKVTTGTSFLDFAKGKPDAPAIGQWALTNGLRLKTGTSLAEVKSVLTYAPVDNIPGVLNDFFEAAAPSATLPPTDANLIAHLEDASKKLYSRDAFCGADALAEIDKRHVGGDIATYEALEAPEVTATGGPSDDPSKALLVGGESGGGRTVVRSANEKPAAGTAGLNPPRVDDDGSPDQLRHDQEARPRPVAGALSPTALNPTTGEAALRAELEAARAELAVLRQQGEAGEAAAAVAEGPMQRLLRPTALVAAVFSSARAAALIGLGVIGLRLRGRGPSGTEDPMQRLLLADPVPDNWLFATPVLEGSVAMDTARIQECKRAQDEVMKTNAKEKTREPLLAVVPGGMGIGKSFLIDNAHTLFFVERDPLVLKVTYNNSQSLMVESKMPRQGLMARLIIAVHRNVSPYSDALVESVLNLRKLTAKEVGDFILTAANGRPVIIGVDEVSELSEEKVVLKEIVNGVTQVVKHIRCEQVDCVGIITALPSIDIRSASRRPMALLTLPALTVEESRSFFRAVLPGSKLTDCELELVHHSCGGHARSLAIAAEWMKINPSSTDLPTARDVYRIRIFLIVTERADDIARAITEVYATKFGDVRTPHAWKLHTEGLIMRTKGGCVAIPPPLLCASGDEAALAHANSMFDKRDSAAKALEWVQQKWDYFRCQHRMSVVPWAMRDTLYGTSAHSFAFDPLVGPVTDRVLAPSGDVASTFIDSTDSSKSINPRSYYVPAAQNHPRFESMCVANNAWDTEQTLVLFQSKINANVKAAVEGLELAVAALRKANVWTGDFLFVIFALDHEGGADRHITQCTHPIIFVNKSTMDDYFTPTLAPAARLHYLRHKMYRG